jgi:hypothetical protein
MPVDVNVSGKGLDVNIVGGDVVSYFNGLMLEEEDTQVTSDGSDITFSIQKLGGGDLTLLFSTGQYTFDCTPAASIVLTPGTDTVPIQNFIYIPITTKVLTVSTSQWPTNVEFVAIATVLCQTAASVQANGVYNAHIWIEHVSNNIGNGHAKHINFWVRQQNATWLSGVSLSPVLGVDEFTAMTTGGIVMQLHQHTYPPFDTTSGSHFFVPNEFGDAFAIHTDLRDLLTDANGVSLEDLYFSLVFWGSVSEDSNDCQLFVNLPTAGYANENLAILDSEQKAVYSIPSTFKGSGFLIARLVLFYDSGTNTWSLSENQDLRGRTPSNAAGSSGGGGISSVEDDPAPTLGGDLDTNGHMIFNGLASGTKLIPGTDTFDFQTDDTSRLDISNSGVRVGATGARITQISDDTTLAADSSTQSITMHAAKTYIDNEVTTLEAEIAAASVAAPYFNGSILEISDFQTSSNGSTITATLEKSGGGDLTLLFSTGSYVLDCTPAASVSLTAGTDVAPTLNYVYVPISTKVLTKSATSWPSEEYIPIAIILCQSASAFQTDGAYMIQSFTNDMIGTFESGHGEHINDWILNKYPDWLSGAACSAIGNIGVFTLSTTSGVVRGLHNLSFPAFNTATGSHVYVPNYTVTPYYRTTDLRTITFTASGGSLADTFFNLVVWGSVGVDGTQLYINVPTTSYDDLPAAIKDINRTAVFTFPDSFKGTGFLISRLTIRYQTGGGGQWTVHNNEDLRGLNPVTARGANWGFMGALSDDNAPSLGGELLTSGNAIREQAGSLTFYSNSGIINMLVGQVNIEQDLTHSTDTDNRIRFGTATQDFMTNNVTRMDVSNSGIRLGAANARVTTILADTTMTSAADTNLYTGLAIRTYVNDTVQPLYDASVITKTDETSQLPNSVPLSGLATGFLANTTGTGVLASRTITGTTNQINFSNGTGAAGNPTATISSTLVLPGTLTLGGDQDVGSSQIKSSGANDVILNAATGRSIDQRVNGTSILDITSAGVRMGATGARVTSISTDGTLASNSDTLLATQKAVKTYVDAHSGSTPTSEVTGTSQSMAVNTKYIANNAGLVTLTLPTTAALGDFVAVRGKGAGLFKIAQNSGQTIRMVGSSTTTGTGGSLTAIERYDAIIFECITANTEWEVVYNTGTYTIV